MSDYACCINLFHEKEQEREKEKERKKERDKERVPRTTIDARQRVKVRRENGSPRFSQKLTGEIAAFEKKKQDERGGHARIQIQRKCRAITKRGREGGPGTGGEY